jgi:hypothetical protein
MREGSIASARIEAPEHASKPFRRLQSRNGTGKVLSQKTRCIEPEP